MLTRHLHTFINANLGHSCTYILYILLYIVCSSVYFSLLYPFAVFCYNNPLSPWGSLKFHPIFTDSEVGWLNDRAKINTSLVHFMQCAACVYFKVHSQHIHISQVQIGGQSLTTQSGFSPGLEKLIWIKTLHNDPSVMQKSMELTASTDILVHKGNS